MIQNHIKMELHSFCMRHKAELLILFGSSASLKQHVLSDVDVAIQFPVNESVSKLHLIHELELIFEPKRIDLVILSPILSPLLLYEIFSKGTPLYERTKGLFYSGKVKAWHLHQDTQPLRKLEKEYVGRRIRELANVT